MTTLERINALFEYCTIIGNPRVIYRGDGLHEKLNVLDSAIGADTEWLSSLECSCLWHIGKTCGMRRAVGARVRMLEEAVALNLVKRKFA